MSPQNTPLWPKNYFELKAFDFLKSLFSPKRSLQKEQSPSIPSPGETLTSSSWIGESESHKTVAPPTCSPMDPFIFQNSNWCFHKCPLQPVRRHLFSQPYPSSPLHLLVKWHIISQISPIPWAFPSSCNVPAHENEQMCMPFLPLICPLLILIHRVSGHRT